jgi:HEAT repeat protein
VNGTGERVTAMAHVFISYAHVDADFVALLKLELEKGGLVVWVDSDRLRAGEDWRQGIDDAIQAAFALIAVMSPEAYQSQYVTYEWAFALGIGVKVIPIMLRSTPLHPRLEAIQYLNFSGRTERPWERLTEQLLEIEANQLPSQVRVARDAPPAIKQAVAKLDSPDTEERKAALDSLAQMSHPAALEALAGAVQHPTRDVQIAAAFKLAELSQYKDKRATAGLVVALRDRDSATVYQATKSLGRIRDPHAIPYLLDALHHEEGRVRRAAASVLSKFGAKVVPELINELDHPVERVQEVAAWALGEIQDPSVLKAVPGLVRALGSSKTALAKAAEEAILKIGQPALGSLMGAIDSLDWNLRLSVVKLLGEIGDKEAIVTLVKATKDENSVVRTAAAEALGILGDASTVNPLIEALHDPESYDVRCAAAISLGIIGDESAVPELIAILEQDMAQPKSGNLNSRPYSSSWPDIQGLNEKHFCKMVAEALRSLNTPAARAAVEQWQREQGGGQA